jgi:hypothetical protein
VVGVDWTSELVMITSQMEKVTTVTLEVVSTTIEASMAQIMTVSEGITKKMRVNSTGTKIMAAVKVSLEVTSLLFKLCKSIKRLIINLR